MKIETPLLNAVRFPVDDTTVLHLHTGDVDSSSPTVVKLEVGPKVYLRRKTTSDLFPLVDVATPYGAGVESLTSLQFRKDEYKNYLTTAKSDYPVLPAALDLRDALRLSLFFRPDEGDTSGQPALIAGIPGRFELVQQDLALVLRLQNGGCWVDCELSCLLEIGAWHLLEVQWDKDRNDGEPLWYVNGLRCTSFPGSLESSLTAAGDRFDVAHDSTDSAAWFWQGALRELELTSAIIWVEDDEPATDEQMYAQAMQLFGLATPTTPVPMFTRGSVAWIRVGGVLHKVSWHHPRATGLGTVIEEARTNLIPDSTMVPAAPMSLPQGRYTLWLEQENATGVEPLTLDLAVPGPTETAYYTVVEHEPLVFEALLDPTVVTFTDLGSGTLTHLQLEAGVGPTSHIPTDGAAVTRQVETLAYLLSESDLDPEQGRLDLEVTPQLTGVRAEVGDEAMAGDILGLSLTREEVVSVDGSGDEATLPGAGLWQAWTTRRFHVEWQPGTRLLVEDTLGLVAGADYSGSWPEASGWFYIGGGGGGGGGDLRANSFFRCLVLDDQVTRFHADLHRFMVRQFGTGGFSEDEGSIFRRWRRVEGDGLAILARLGDELKEQAFADTVDALLVEWEQALGIPTPAGASKAERQALLADLFKALGATDAELEERVAYLTGAAVVIERHLGDVGSNLREMYEFYIKIPASAFRDSLLGLLQYLIERQEPAHTFGWPVVRTELVTHSETYGSVGLGPGESETFEELSSLTERDCIGLPSNYHLVPQGMWMPTNDPLRKDLWEDAFSDVVLPSVLFPFTELGGSLTDKISMNLVLNPPAGSSVEYMRPCAGLLVADKKQAVDESHVKINIRRGVELRDSANDRFFSDTGTEVFDLGLDRSGAFLLLFRLAALPGSGERGYLFYCTYGDFFYRLCVDGVGALIAEFQGDPSSALTVASIGSPPIQAGEWICALVVIDQESAGDRTMRLFSSHGDPSALVDLSNTAPPTGTTTTFCLGGVDSGNPSARVHEAYFAGWVGPHAAVLDQGLIERFWRALNPAYGLVLERAGDTPAGWPVGPSPDPADMGELACKVTPGQFPYAVLGSQYDGAGLLQDVRGYGCNRSLVNHAPYSETLDAAGWEWSTSVLPAGLAVSPEGVGNAARFVFSAGGDIYTDVVPAPATYVSLSCWVRLDREQDGNPTTDEVPCGLFLRDPADPLFAPETVYAFPGSPVITGQWQRIVAVFTTDTWPAALEAGLAVERAPLATGDGVAVWGFQITKEPSWGPYVPNLGSGTAAVEATRLWFDPEDFPGYQDRGFASLRVKLEECVDRLAAGQKVVLLDAVDSGHPTDNHAVLWLGEINGSTPGPGPGLSFTLQFEREVGGGVTEPWMDTVQVRLGTEEDELDWSDPGVEHQLAVGWDLSRPVAMTERHLALWVDGVRVETYPLPRPADPMNQALLLDTVYLGYGRPPGDVGGVGHQGNAVFREVELYTRHHPGLYTPTRLESRETQGLAQE